jgi:hypothetical protein
MADEKGDKNDKADVAKPKEPPKPVQLGGESLLDRVIPHIKKILSATIILSVLITLFFGYKACRRRQETKSTEKITAVLDIANRPVKIPGFPAPPGTQAFETDKDRAEKVLDEMAKQDTETPSTAFRASMLLDVGKIDEAIALYRTCQTGTTIEHILCREGLGIALETKALAEKDSTASHKLLEESLDAFLRMQPAEDGPRRAYALYHQARISIQLGKKPEGRALLEKVKAMTGAPRELLDLVDKRLGTLGAA